ncbi:Bgt-4474 [Blumeria graminis f. sp. tritici]|uniref:Bgt-4474 n=2 Tax=Blumeria graminis f. sp. tritici TaxID=62690 RepID=A0A061HFT4_BLUGR|nr:hypothetical protein BGT96224_4474 [Blumeria graminis f. sp. tritici 96224]VDB95067.1 Bgt-4474 [Blumeria graminis f. sp. tritici]
MLQRKLAFPFNFEFSSNCLPAKEEIPWPPRSPHHALLSTPSGRQHLKKLRRHDSQSPSPRKRVNSSTPPAGAENATLGVASDNDSDDDDDEETLKLQLKEIQARLKLKKLQKVNKQGLNTNHDKLSSKSTISSTKKTFINTSEKYISKSKERKVISSPPRQVVDVPSSPIKRVEQLLPRKQTDRVLLGIDKGVKGYGVSLKRAPSLISRDDNVSNRLFPETIRQSVNWNLKAAEIEQKAKNQPKSFNERIAETRSQDRERQIREARMKNKRSSAFDINQEQIQILKQNAIDFPDIPRCIPEFSREEILHSVKKLDNIDTKRLSISNLRSDVRSNKTKTAFSSEKNGSKVIKANPESKLSDPSSNHHEPEVSQFEPYSSQHLTKRIIPHQRLTRTLAEKKIYLIPDILREVKAPEYSTPDIENDFVLLGIVASKSEPKIHQQCSKNEKRGKFMAVTLTDLKWELDLFLFDSAFEKFWKLTVGTIIAILNPQIMPPPRGREDTGKFSLTLNSDADTVLEIGTARDLGFCKSIKRDGKTCSSWVDKRHTEFCDYHVNASLQKTHASRMEVNTMTFGKGRLENFGSEKRKFNPLDKKRHDKLNGPRNHYDRESHSHVFIGSKSTTKLLDDVDFDPDAFHRGSNKEERMTRRLLSQERERKLEKKLATLGSGLGAEYARARQGVISGTTVNSKSNFHGEFLHDTTRIISEVKKQNVSLSPLKRKKGDSFSESMARGWGGSLTNDLKRMKDGENLSAAAVKKKARFANEKGIKETGSWDLCSSTAQNVKFDISDDDLDIVR